MFNRFPKKTKQFLLPLFKKIKSFFKAIHCSQCKEPTTLTKFQANVNDKLF